MFSSSVRRAVYAQPSPFVSAIANVSAPRAVCTQTLAVKQRRYSSSKPSSPADGQRGVAVPVVQVKAGESKKGKKAQKKKGTEGLPSVPSTGHLQVKGMPIRPPISHQLWLCAIANVQLQRLLHRLSSPSTARSPSPPHSRNPSPMSRSLPSLRAAPSASASTTSSPPSLAQ